MDLGKNNKKTKHKLSLNDIVLDPFIESDITAVVGLKNGRKFIGYEINEDYVQIANERISSLQPSLFQSDGERLSIL